MALALWGQKARAATAARQALPFRLIWSSSAGCGKAQTFLAELGNRTALLREARENEHAITLIVETFGTLGGVRGQLTVRKPDGDLTVREVPGQNCEEVASAMALIAALMVDPLANDRAGADQRAQTLERSPEVDVPALGSAWSLRLEQRLTGHSAIAPHLAWGEAAGVMLTRERGGLRPSLGLSAHFAQATTTRPQGSAELQWAAAQLVLCPIGVRPDETWDLRACPVLQLGRLRGAGFDTARPAAKTILWSSAGIELQGRYRLLGPLWLGWEGALTLPFSRERFYLEPEPTLHRIPAWALSFGVGVGVRFF